MPQRSLPPLVRQFVGFCSVGTLTTLLGLVLFWLCVRAGMQYIIANALGFVVCVAVSYALNNRVTFRGAAAPDLRTRVLRVLKVYASYSFTGLLLNSILLWLWIDQLGVGVSLAPVLNLFITVPINFLINKYWAYT